MTSMLAPLCRWLRARCGVWWWWWWRRRRLRSVPMAEPAPKKRRLAAGERFVPPPRKLNPGVSFGAEHFAETSYYFERGLRKVRPYYFDFRTYCKGRWVGRSLRHVFSTEFRAQPIAYYREAARAGRLRLNEEPVRDLEVVLKNNDFLRNTVHRHEPPVTAQPIQILVEDDEVVVVDKPSSLPVHPCGRFRHNTVIFILGKEHHLKELHTIHRLDRMTSGVLMFAKSLEVSKRIDEQVRERQLEKEYVCRVVGEFPAHEVVCEEPILVVSYKVGVCRVDPKGKPCKTVFRRLSYNGKSSVVRCLPRTGRTHQIRVHLQYLGHPILNDPIYNMEAWGPEKGKGGKIDKTDEELLKALVEEHRSKQSLDVLDIAEEELSSVVENKDCGDSGGCSSVRADPGNENSCPDEETADPMSNTGDPEGNGTRACLLNSGNLETLPGSNLEMLENSKKLGLCDNQNREMLENSKKLGLCDDQNGEMQEESLENGLEGPSSEEKRLEGLSSEEKRLEGLSSEEKRLEGLSSEEKRLEGPSSEGKSLERPSSEGKSLEGPSSEEKRLEGPSSEGKSLEGPSSEGKSLEGPSSEGKSLEGLSSEGKSLEGPSSEEKSLEGPSSEEKRLEGPSSEGKSLEGPSSEEKCLEGLSSEEKCLEGPSSEGKSLEGPSSEEKCLEGLSSEEKRLEGPSSEEKRLEGLSSEGKSLEGPSSEEKRLEGPSWEEKDPLCLECKLSRRDPSPKELVMFLHALRYKGVGFEYCSRMPEWAREDWEEGEDT